MSMFQIPFARWRNRFDFTWTPGTTTRVNYWQKYTLGGSFTDSDGDVGPLRLNDGISLLEMYQYYDYGYALRLSFQQDPINAAAGRSRALPRFRLVVGGAGGIDVTYPGSWSAFTDSHATYGNVQVVDYVGAGLATAWGLTPRACSLYF